MHRAIGSLALFAAGIGVGAFLMSPGRAQTAPVTGLRLNHVGIYVKDFEESMRFYTQSMGLREAFTIRDANGKPTLAYLQITRDTFLELAPSTADRPVGLSHIGIWPEDQAAAIAALRAHGVQVADPRVGSTKTSITSVTDPNGVRLELVDFLPGSLPKKAIDEWKP
jgi:catechol 2,3-dioxygenase-like lactoylglutathione lyase family enzyme